MDTVTKVVGAVVLALMFGFLLAILFALPVMWLWNWLLPDLFGFKTIGFWQAFGVMMLGQLIFGRTTTSKSN